jgi:TRAP-type C4-dicarboxylate transport system permease small subunit
VETIWKAVERTLGAVAVLALASLVILPATQVVLRSLFDNPITGLEEGTRWGLIILVFLGTPLLISTNQHIRLAEFIDLLPRPPRLALERFILFASGLTFAVIAFSGVLSVMRNFGTRTPTLDIPFWLFASPILIGFALAAIGYLWLAVRAAAPPQGAGPPIV